MGEKKKKFVFVDWLDDNSVGVMPTSAIKRGQKVGVGKICLLRWGKGEFYDAKLLKFSDDRQDLLADMERHIAGIDIDAPDTADSTTEDTPVKNPPKKSKQVRSAKKKAAEACKQSSIARANAILSSMNYSDESSEEDEKEIEIKRLKQELEKMRNERAKSSVVMNNSISHSSFEALQKIDNTNDAAPTPKAGKSASHYADNWDAGTTSALSVPKTFHYDDSWDVDVSSSESDEEEVPVLCEYERKRMKRIKENRALLESLNLTSAKEELKALSTKRLKGGHSKGSKKPRVGTALSLSAERTPVAHKVDPTQGRKLEFGHSTVNPVAVGDEIYKKRRVQELELVAGYGVYLTRRQLDECVDGAGNSSTRLMRNLLNVFFTPDQLANSSAMGTRVHKGLDQDILSACIKFVQDKFSVSRAVLIDAVNDKCSQYRRKMKVELPQ